MLQVPENLPPYDEDNDEWRVVIETPKGCRNKYKFDDAIRTFVLNGVLPEGMSFPYDFGFLPATRAADGDPIDVLLIMDEPAFCGCVVPARLIGVIEAEQTETDGTAERNDRLVAISTKCRNHSDIRSLKDLDEHRVDEIQQFFVSYNRVRGKRFKVLSLGGPKKAESLARQAMKHSKNGTSKRKAKQRA